MASDQIKIYGKGHSLCLQRLLQTSLSDETFADVIIVTFCPSTGKKMSTKANRSVLAAASPLFKHLLESYTFDEEAVIIFPNYHPEDISNVLMYIYTGKVVCCSSEKGLSLRNILDELKVGTRWTIETASLQEYEFADNPVVNQNKKSKSFLQQEKNSTLSEVKSSPQYSYRERSERCWIASRNPHKLDRSTSTIKCSEVEKSTITCVDPTATAHHFEIMSNPDVFRTCNILEKTSMKYNILPEIKNSNSSYLDWPRLNDRIGIYFDPQLYNYYQGLVKSLPPIRIYLHVDETKESIDENEESHLMFQKSGSVYTKKSTLDTPIHHKSLSGRLAVKEICFVNGKRHLTLEGEAHIDPSIKLIEYPQTDHLEADSEQTATGIPMDVEGDPIIQQFLEEESRRKRVLLSTLSRLRKDFSNAKQVAREILRASKNDDCQTSVPGQKLRLPMPSRKSVQQVVCEICGKLVTASWIRVHMANHQGERNFLCEHCGRSFASSNLLKSHVHYQHNADLDYVKCPVCSKSFSKKSRLETHMRIHNGDRPYQCNLCDKKFHTNGNLRKHMMVHSGEKPHKCHLCDKSFTQGTSLRLHLRIHQQLSDMGKSDVQVRKPEQTYVCEFCPMTFSRERHFYVHRCTHTGEKPALPCSNCQLKFSNINELKQHKLKEHPGTVHQCHFCDKSFFKKTANLRHMLTHTQGPLPKPTYHCQHCSAQFTTAAARTVHERRHTGERPFQCPNCEKSFSSKYNFRQHLRMHSDERPFQCSVCNKAFRQPQHLRAHSYIHKNQDEPVPCPICGKVFRNKILLMSHKRIHKQSTNSLIPVTEVGDNSTNTLNLLSSIQINDGNPENSVNLIVLPQSHCE